MKLELKRPWPHVCLEDGASYGGSQNWFSGGSFAAGGCGVIACADTLLYLRGMDGLTRQEYIDYVNSLRRYFPLIPYRGIDGVRLAIGMNLCLRRASLPLRARWSVSGRLFAERLRSLLADDLPVILSVGPNFPAVWGRERVTLYRRTQDGYTAAERTSGHFMTATGLDDEWLRVSTWGGERFIRRGELDRYRRANGAVFTNLLSLRRV
ncbi:MAG: hypothetical protein IJU66_04785 [Oscillospiraceae bacterium]|nr:hypothetical protein [Oscillospiraceae bacterium]